MEGTPRCTPHNQASSCNLHAGMCLPAQAHKRTAMKDWGQAPTPLHSMLRDRMQGTHCCCQYSAEATTGTLLLSVLP